VSAAHAAAARDAGAHSARGGAELWVCQLGVVPYREALELQERLRAARQREAIADVMLLLEHPPVYTRGRRASDAELVLGEDWYRDRGIDVVDVDRGGKVTYHGPGQLVGYPIVRTGEVAAHVRALESALVEVLAAEGIAARSRPEDGPAYTGVWVQERKIASIGVHVSRGVTTHGFALNVDVDLEPFQWVIACGLPGVTMTSMARELAPPGAAGAPPPTGRMRCVRRRAAFEVARALGRRQRLISRARLQAAIDAALGGAVAGSGGETAGSAGETQAARPGRHAAVPV